VRWNLTVAGLSGAFVAQSGAASARALRYTGIHNSRPISIAGSTVEPAKCSFISPYDDDF
jgi:hypothetical protein